MLYLAPSASLGLQDLSCQDVRDFVGQVGKSRVCLTITIELPVQLVPSVGIQGALPLLLFFPAGVVLHEGYLGRHFLGVVDRVGRMMLRAWRLLCLSAVEVLRSARLVADVGIGLLERVGQVVVGLASRCFGGVGVGTLPSDGCTFA